MAMNTEFYYREKIPVAILGATGLVGQRFIELLQEHPWFKIEALIASEQSAGKPYGEVVDWQMGIPLPEEIAKIKILPPKPNLDCSIAFSALTNQAAGPIEKAFAEAGYAVISNARSHRMDPTVPLIVPEVNARHFKMIQNQTYHDHGFIVTNPNCAVIGLVMALKPLYDQFGIEAVQVSTLQAISGAGNRSATKEAVNDNVIPYIQDEEEKIETEPHKILGALMNSHIEQATFPISAHCNRVPVSDGHLENISLRLKQKASRQEIIDAWSSFKGEPQALSLPSAPENPIHYFHDDDQPQPKKLRNLEKGMAVSIGRLRQCKNFDWKFSILSHNTVRGAAGTAILNGEMLVKNGSIFW